MTMCSTDLPVRGRTQLCGKASETQKKTAAGPTPTMPEMLVEGSVFVFSLIGSWLCPARGPDFLTTRGYCHQLEEYFRCGQFSAFSFDRMQSG